MTPPKRRRLPLAGLSLIGAGGVLGVALTMPGAAYAEPRPSTAKSSGPSESGESPAVPADPSTGLLRARLDRAVAADRLTPEQAAAILTAARAGLLNGDLVAGPGRDPGGRGPAIDRQPGR